MFSPISATLRMVCLNAHTTESMNILNWGGEICRYAVGEVHTILNKVQCIGKLQCDNNATQFAG